MGFDTYGFALFALCYASKRIKKNSNAELFVEIQLGSDGLIFGRPVHYHVFFADMRGGARDGRNLGILTGTLRALVLLLCAIWSMHLSLLRSPGRIFGTVRGIHDYLG